MDPPASALDDPESRDGAIVWSGPVLVSNRLILASSNGYAVSVSPYTGQLLGRVEIPDGTEIAPGGRQPDALSLHQRRPARGAALTTGE